MSSIIIDPSNLAAIKADVIPCAPESLPDNRAAIAIIAGQGIAVITGTTAGTAAAGDDARIVGALQKAQNLADLTNPATARGNLGLGTMALEATATYATSAALTTLSGRVTATEAALPGKADLVAGKIPANQLPAGFDNYDDYANLAAFPAVGDSNVLYVARDTNKTYRWNGASYSELGDGGVALGETDSTAYRGDRGKTAYDHTALTNNPHGVTKAQVGLSAADNTSDATKNAAAATLTNKSLGAGTKIVLGGDATGDIYYRAADGTLARLAAGTTGQVLAMGATLPAWTDAAAGGGGGGNDGWAYIRTYGDDGAGVIGDSGKPFETLQAALDAFPLVGGDTIRAFLDIGDQIYNDLVIEGTLSGASLSIRGAGRDLCGINSITNDGDLTALSIQDIGVQSTTIANIVLTKPLTPDAPNFAPNLFILNVACAGTLSVIGQDNTSGLTGDGGVGQHGGNIDIVGLCTASYVYAAGGKGANVSLDDGVPSGGGNGGNIYINGPAIISSNINCAGGAPGDNANAGEPGPNGNGGVCVLRRCEAPSPVVGFGTVQIVAAVVDGTFAAS